MYHIYLSKLKSDAFEKIKKYIAWALQETGMQLKVLHSDGEGEFKNDDLTKWMKKHYVTWRPSTLYTQEQNSKTKRLNYTLMSSACFILVAMKSFLKVFGQKLFKGYV